MQANLPKRVKVKQSLIVVSELNAGTVNLTSRKGDVDVLGSTLNAKRLELDVAKNLNVESVQDTTITEVRIKTQVGVWAYLPELMAIVMALV